MLVSDNPRHRISRVQYQWLRAQVDLWTSEGLIDPAARDRIVARYDPEALQRQGMIVIVLLAVVMCAVGLLLLIGYNWALIPRGAKIALLAGSVAAAYGAAARAYATEHPVAGETLAFAGTLLFGNAIVLISQVLQISGHFPNAVLWFTIGVLASAWLVRSRWIGVEAAVALFAWTLAQGSTTAGPLYAFLVLWPAAVAVAYALNSPLMLFVVATDAGMWAFMSGIDASRSAAWLASVVLTACALYSAGRWHRSGALMRWAWQGAGLLVLLLVLLPLMASPIQDSMSAAESAPLSAAIACAALVVAFAGLARRPWSVTDRALVVTIVATAGWAVAVSTGLEDAIPRGRLGTVLFSLVTLGVAVALVRDALDRSGVPELALGVLFAAGFLIVRWTSVIENMFWSGLLLLAAGAGLLLVARLWRTRPSAAAAAGRMS